MVTFENQIQSETSQYRSHDKIRIIIAIILISIIAILAIAIVFHEQIFDFINKSRERRFSLDDMPVVNYFLVANYNNSRISANYTYGYIENNTFYQLGEGNTLVNAKTKIRVPAVKDALIQCYASDLAVASIYLGKIYEVQKNLSVDCNLTKYASLSFKRDSEIQDGINNIMNIDIESSLGTYNYPIVCLSRSLGISNFSLPIQQLQCDAGWKNYSSTYLDKKEGKIKYRYLEQNHYLCNSNEIFYCAGFVNGNQTCIFGQVDSISRMKYISDRCYRLAADFSDSGRYRLQLTYNANHLICGDYIKLIFLDTDKKPGTYPHYYIYEDSSGADFGAKDQIYQIDAVC